MRFFRFAFHKYDFTHLTVYERWFAGIFILSSLGVWLFLLSVMLLATTSALTLILLAVSGLLWLVCLALTLIFLKPSTAILVYAPLILLIFIAFGLRDLNFIGVLGFVVCLWWAYKRAQNEKRLLVNFQPLRVARSSLPIFFAGLSLLLAFAYNSIIISDSLKEPRVSKTFFSLVYTPADLLLRISIPGFNSQTTISELQGTFIENILPNILPKSILNSGANNRLFSTQFTNPEIGAQTPKEFTFNWLNQNIDSIISPYRGLLPIFFVVGLFFTFKFIFFIFMWVVFALVILVAKLLLLYNIVSVRKIAAQKEEVFLR